MVFVFRNVNEVLIEGALAASFLAHRQLRLPRHLDQAVAVAVVGDKRESLLGLLVLRKRKQRLATVSL